MSRLPLAPLRASVGLLILLPLVLGAASALWVTAAGEEKGPGSESAHYIKFHPDFVVNLRSDDRPHFLMVTVQGMSKSVEDISRAKHHMPAIRHHILMLLSEQTPESVKSVEDKQRLMGETLDTVRELLIAETGRPVIEEIYFTDFVLE